MPETSTRARELERAGEVMREFMARAVLFQDAVAKWGGVNGTDLQVASLLMGEGPATPGELAERTGLTAGGAITTAIDRLERAGFVSRDRDPGDRRRVIVTANAEAILDRFGEVYGRVGERWNAYLDTLTDDQLAFANDLFARAAEVNREEIERLRAR
jgi:DNA-binding MarR family transcriptional regulator